MGVGDDAGLVVSGSASEQPLPAPLGGEGVGLVPAGRVADGLNVVVGVEQDVRAALGAGLVGQDGGPAGGAVGAGTERISASRPLSRRRAATASAERWTWDWSWLEAETEGIATRSVRSETMVGMEVCTAVRTASTVIMVFRVSRRCR